MTNPQGKILKGTWIQPEPINEHHKSDLFIAAQNEEIWASTAAKAFGEKFYPWFDKALLGLHEKRELPFIVRRLSDEKIIGSTRYYDIRREHQRLTVGYTWYVPEVWGSYVNPESKLLLFQFAFEELNVNRVEFATDARNVHSRAAIKKLGAKEEGVLRQHMVLTDGFIRDTVMFSIVKSEWPEIKAALQTRLENFKKITAKVNFD